MSCGSDRPDPQNSYVDQKISKSTPSNTEDHGVETGKDHEPNESSVLVAQDVGDSEIITPQMVKDKQYRAVAHVGDTITTFSNGEITIKSIAKHEWGTFVRMEGPDVGMPGSVDEFAAAPGGSLYLGGREELEILEVNIEKQRVVIELRYPVAWRMPFSF